MVPQGRRRRLVINESHLRVAFLFLENPMTKSVHHSTASYTRPNDTNAYTAGDVLAESTSAPTVLTFKGAIRNGNSILKAALCIDSVAAGTKPDLELWLFHTAPTAVNDNAAFTITDAEALTLAGIVPFAVATFQASALNCACQKLALDLPLKGSIGSRAMASQDLYGIVVVRNAYTPAANEVFTFSLLIES
jgi:hypothetical protein